jgi:NADH:ubiquinone oxidoreductase subunit E/NAD-dependent dihydropyrimidine dehydrogenase PreA subunit
VDLGLGRAEVRRSRKGDDRSAERDRSKSIQNIGDITSGEALDDTKAEVEATEYEARVGVYVCECGINISSTVDVERVAKLAESLPNVAVSRFYKYMCSDPGQQLIKDDIKEHGLTHVVVASCSPRMHEPTFKACVEEAGLNPYCFEMANIREQCSWVHKDMEMGTKKAYSLVAAAVARAALLEPLEKKTIGVTPTALVVGGGIAGIQAALDIADTGYKTYLIERTPSIGGRMAQLDKTFPTLDCSACILTPKMVDVARHPNIELLTYSEITDIDGYVGNYKIKVKKKARSVDEDKCTGCGVCTENCPVMLLPQVQERPDEAPETRDKDFIDELIVKHSHHGAPLVQIMLNVNEHYRYLPRDVLEYLSFKLDIPLSTIYRAATFYKAFNLELRGKYHIKVCLGTGCHVRGARNLTDIVRDRIAGTEEGLFSLETVNCLGTCAMGPVVLVNDEPHGEMNPEKVNELISSLEAK